jgi:acyl-coenzyme A thioesterase PaaI-like protein
MYAGVLFTVGEVLGGAIAAGSFDLSKVYPVVKDLKISFRRPATTGVTAKTSMTEETIAELDAKARSGGMAEFVLAAELFDETGELVAQTEGTYQIRAHGS